MPPAGVRARTDPSTVHQEALRGSLSVTAERLVRLLGAELSLCGNRGDAPSSRQHQYQPLVFGREVPFFHELFCRGLNLLAKTRREMRAKTQHDQDKVGMGTIAAAPRRPTSVSRSADGGAPASSSRRCCAWCGGSSARPSTRRSTAGTRWTGG